MPDLTPANMTSSRLTVEFSSVKAFVKAPEVF
jgi:hypothetical protein